MIVIPKRLKEENPLSTYILGAHCKNVYEFLSRSCARELYRNDYDTGTVSFGFEIPSENGYYIEFHYIATITNILSRVYVFHANATPEMFIGGSLSLMPTIVSRIKEDSKFMKDVQKYLYKI